MRRVFPKQYILEYAILFCPFYRCASSGTFSSRPALLKHSKIIVRHHGNGKKKENPVFRKRMDEAGRLAREENFGSFAKICFRTGYLMLFGAAGMMLFAGGFMLMGCIGDIYLCRVQRGYLSPEAAPLKDLVSRFSITYFNFALFLCTFKFRSQSNLSEGTEYGAYKGYNNPRKAQLGGICK